MFDRAIKVGATATMPPANMFWGARYGKLIDPFGHHWSVSHQLEEVSTEEMFERMPARMKTPVEV